MIFVKSIKDNKKITGLISFLFVILLVPNLLLPFISDDVSFGMITGAHGFIHNFLSITYHFYFDWSGRLLTDFSSRIILQLPTFVIALIKTVSLLIVLYLIVRLPQKLLKFDNSKFVISYLLIFLTYWLCNPNLGQTTFWLVGASNYLFTNLWILLYLNVAFSNYLNVRKTFRILIFIFIAFGSYD